MNRHKASFEREQENYKTTYANYNLGAVGYWFMIGLIGVLDFFFNLTSLYSLGLNPIFTIIASLAISILVAGLVHVLGIVLAKNPFEKSKGNTLAKKLLLGVMLFMLFAVMIAMTILRGSYFSSLQKQFTISGITLEINPVITSLVLGGLTILFALMGIMIGHGRYEPKTAERRTALSKALKRLRLAQHGLIRAERIHQKMLKRFHRAEANRKNEFVLMRNNVEEINKIICVLTKHYRMYYERMAKKKRPAEAVQFDPMPPASEMPEGLRELDERCAT